MKLHKRNNSPFWVVDLVGADGTRVRKSTGERNRAAALEKANRIQEKIEKERAALAEGKPSVTIAEALERYLGKLRVQRASSVAEWEILRDKLCGARRHSRAHPEELRWSLDPSRPLESLTVRDLEELKEHRTAEGLSLQSIAHELKLLRAASYYAEDLGCRTPNIRRWNIPTPPEKTRYLTLEEWRAVYDRLSPGAETRVVHAGKPNRPYVMAGRVAKGRQDAQDLFVFLTMTGARLSEATHLSWEQVDLVGGTVRLWGSKVGKEREVPITPQARAILERRKAAREPGAVFVFPGEGGDTPRGRTELIGAAMDACGLNRPDLVARMGRATIHSLRHTYATWLRSRGVGLDDVSDLLGHASLDMTRRYAHIGREERLSRARKALADVTVQGR